MKSHGYKLAGSGIPAELKGLVVPCPLPETSDEATSLTADGNPNRWLVLGNQQFLLNTEREVKATAESKEVTDMIAAGKINEAKALCLAAAMTYRDGGGRKAGTPNVAKVKAAAVDTAKGKLATMSEADKAKNLKTLAALGFDVSLFQ